MPCTRLSIAVAAVPLMGAAAAQAALAPNYQRARELTAVVDAVAAVVERHPIDQVIHEGELRYKAIAGPCTVPATIVPEPAPGIAGPMKFSVVLGEPECKE